MGRSVSGLKKELLTDAEFIKEYKALEEEFSIASTLIEARRTAGLSQEQVAAKMGTTQSVVARIESGRPLPSLRTLMRYAVAVGRKLEIRLPDAA
jgi:ribosome-binding protein aMBF1 (putative translation factor)